MTEFREFKVGDLFDICATNGIYNAVDVNISDIRVCGSHPYIVRTSKNNGSRGYLIEDESRLNEGNTITFAQDTAQIFYQYEPYFTGDKIKVFKLKGYTLNEDMALYLITALTKSFSEFKWGSFYKSSVLNNILLYLPVRLRHEVDWAKIASIGGGSNMSNIDTSSWKEFSYTDIFELQRVIHKLDKLSLSAKGKTPVYSSDSSNNGIVGYTEQEPDFIVNDANAAYVVFGDHTRTFNIVTESFCVMDNVKVLKPKVVNTDVLLFICTVWKKHIKDLGYARHWSIAKDVKFKLPVTTVYEPDFDYMEKYIRIQKKLAIKDAVLLKDKIIEETKKVVE